MLTASTLKLELYLKMLYMYMRYCNSTVNAQTFKAGSLTDPEVVEPLAHGATLVWDLIEVLVKTWLEGDEPRQGREVVF